MEKTVVFSTRVPVDVNTTIRAHCKSKGITVSKYLLDSVITVNEGNLFKEFGEGGSVQLRTMPEDLETFLKVSGVVVSGTLAFKGMSSMLGRQVNKDGKAKFTDLQINMMALCSAIVVGFIANGAIDSLISGK